MGEKFCISGGIPNDLLAFGTPEDIKDCCKKIIKTVGKDGRYILDASAIIQKDAKVVGLSVLLTGSFEGISQTVKEIEAGGIREKVLIMIGGAPTSELVREKTGADFYGKNAFDGVKFASKIYKIN